MKTIDEKASVLEIIELDGQLEELVPIVAPGAAASPAPPPAAVTKLMYLHIIGAILLVSLTATITWAQQPVHSVQELQSILKADDEMKVTDRNGKTTAGRFVVISDSSLTLNVRGARQQFPEATIREIKIRRPHDGKTTLLGAAIGGVAGGALSASAHPGADGANPSTTAMGVLVGAGVGAGVVALKHVFTPRYQTVFIASGMKKP